MKSSSAIAIASDGHDIRGDIIERIVNCGSFKIGMAVFSSVKCIIGTDYEFSSHSSAGFIRFSGYTVSPYVAVCALATHNPAGVRLTQVIPVIIQFGTERIFVVSNNILAKGMLAMTYQDPTIDVS
ncbi:MAG: hypothetical protein G8D89_16390 [gamma proteobacterium symbiont of Clathrolucina costata]